MQVYPKILSISHSNGSVAGGLMLTISGLGFSSVTTDNAVDVNGVRPSIPIPISLLDWVCAWMLIKANYRKVTMSLCCLTRDNVANKSIESSSCLRMIAVAGMHKPCCGFKTASKQSVHRDANWGTFISRRKQAP